MSDSPQIARHVVLPWAPYAEPAESDDDGVASRVHASARQLRVTTDKMTVGPRGSAGHPDEAPAHEKKAKLDARLEALGLPYQPHPAVPAADRVELHKESLVSLAVALDIVATMTAGLKAEPSILQRYTSALAHIGELGGVTKEMTEGLLHYAGSAAATHRAHLSRALAACMHTARIPAPKPGLDTAPSTPRTVTSAIRQVETAGRIVVREATLLLQAHAPVEYWQA